MDFNGTLDVVWSGLVGERPHINELQYIHIYTAQIHTQKEFLYFYIIIP